MEKYMSKTSVSLFLVVLSVCLEKVLTGLILVTFTKAVTCKLQERLNLGSAEMKSGEASSLIKCAADCVETCFGVSVDKDNHCYHHRDSTGAISCSSGDIFFELYYRNPCKHNGAWDPVGRACKCVDGWVGDRCERYPRDCKELSTFGYNDTYYRPTFLQPENHPRPFKVHCSHYRSIPAYVTYVLHNDGNYDNTKTWDDYVNGFYNGDHNYFAGLGGIRALTDVGHNNLYLVVVYINGTSVYPFNGDFRIGSASTGYQVNSTNKVNTQDCITPTIGVSFSTADRDNGRGSSRCAIDGKAGWWFKTCADSCNLLGPRNYWKVTGYNLDSDAKYVYITFQDV